MTLKTARIATAFLCVIMALSLSSQNAMARSRKNKKARHAVNEPDVPYQAQPEAPIVIDRAEGSTLYFKATSSSGSTGDVPKPMVLDALSDIQPIGTLRGASGGNPYYLIRARPCRDCKQDPSIFIVQPGYPKLARFVEPGKILDNKSRATVMDSRAFYGHCLASRAGDVYVVFQKEKVDRRKQPQQSVLVIEPKLDTIEGGKTYDHLHETLLERNFPNISRTLHFVKAHLCKELDGRHRVMASRPADVNLKRQKASEDEDDEDSDAPRENQSDRDYDGAAPPATD